MKDFTCRVVSPEGQRSKLVRSGVDSQAVVRDLQAQGWTILEVRAMSRSPRAKRLRPAFVLDFSRSLALFLGQGLLLKDALRIAAEVPRNAEEESIWRQISRSIENGQTLHEALSPWAAQLPPLYWGMIQVGERSGRLAEVLKNLAEHLETARTLADKTIQALTYPVFVLGVAILGLGGLSVFVLPHLTGMVEGINPQAAEQYRSRLDSLQFVGIALFAGLVAVVIAAVSLLVARGQNKEFRRKLDRVLWSTPLIRDWVHIRSGLYFCFAMETLLGSGYSVESALDDAGKVLGNTWMQLQIQNSRKTVLQGEPLSKALRRIEHLPPVLAAWIAVGEGANSLLASFGQLRRHFSQQSELLNARYLALVEPALILLVGLVVAGLVVGVVVPIFSMIGNVF